MFCNNSRMEQNMPYGYPGDIDINITNQNANMNTLENFDFVNTGVTQMPMSQPMAQPMSAPVPMPNQMMHPIVEPGQERIVHRNYVHEVPHVCPMNTKVINHHIYRHTYQPRYSSCEENVVTNEQCGSCCQYR